MFVCILPFYFDKKCENIVRQIVCHCETSDRNSLSL